METTFIKIEGYAFYPAEVTVKIDTAIRWDNLDSLSHSLETYDTYDDSFQTGPIQSQEFHTIILTRTGDAKYWCSLPNHHEMGIIHVVE